MYKVVRLSPGYRSTKDTVPLQVFLSEMVADFYRRFKPRFQTEAQKHHSQILHIWRQLIQYLLHKIILRHVMILTCPWIINLSTESSRIASTNHETKSTDVSSDYNYLQLIWFPHSKESMSYSYTCRYKSQVSHTSRNRQDWYYSRTTRQKMKHDSELLFCFISSEQIFISIRFYSFISYPLHIHFNIHHWNLFNISYWLPD